MIQWMKENGFHYYNLGAFNPEFNSAIYIFKKWIAEKKGWEGTFFGEHHGCFNLIGRIAKFLLDSSKFLKGITSK